jgi:hypothetical protein
LFVREWVEIDLPAGCALENLKPGDLISQARTRVATDQADNSGVVRHEVGEFATALFARSTEQASIPCGAWKVTIDHVGWNATRGQLLRTARLAAIERALNSNLN